MPSTHQFSAMYNDPGYCRCGLAKNHAEHLVEQPGLPGLDNALTPEQRELAELKRRIEQLLSNTGSWSQCKGCFKPIYWMVHNGGKKVPYTPEGLNHFIDCPAAAQFRKEKQP